MKKCLALALFIFTCNTALANTLNLNDAVVTRVQVYETTDNSTNVWIHLNSNSRVGPNPVNSEYSCELWTKDKGVHSTALAAMMAGKKVDVSYVDRGEGTHWCKVQMLAVKAD
jgi:hypothetical protein